MEPAHSEGRRLKLTIICEPVLTDSISDFLVGIFDAAVEVGVEDDLEEHTLQAFIVEEDDNREETAAIVSRVSTYIEELAKIFHTSVPRMEVSLFEDEDWSRNWKEHFHPFAIVPGLVIKPTWERYKPRHGEKVIEMDPGMAFGTGHHATTSLCMSMMREHLKTMSAASLLDVGTGTGILAMAGALWGAGRVFGIDNDPVAVEAAQQNARMNGLSQTIAVESTLLEDVEGSFDIVVANIIHDVLLQMRDDLYRLVAPEGILVLSGILRGDQMESIIAGFTGKGFLFINSQERDEWAALCFRK